MRGVLLGYSQDTMLIGVTEPIKAAEFCTMLSESMMSSSCCRGSDVDVSSIVRTKLFAAMALAIE